MSAMKHRMDRHARGYLFVIFPDNIPPGSWIFIKFTAADRRVLCSWFPIVSTCLINAIDRPDR